MKRLINAAVLTLAIASSVPAAYGNSIINAGRVPRIVSSVEFPRVRRWRIVRHTFRLQIPQESRDLSHLSIDVPAGLTVKNNITVTDQSGRKINTNVSVNGSKVIVAFPEPVAPVTRLKIDMNKVKVSGRSNAWLYRVSAKLVGLNADIPVGIARFRVY